MNIAILSAGPSLKHTYDEALKYDLKLSVNAAAAMYYSDWWVCGDAETFARVEPTGLPVLFTLTDSDGQFNPPRVQERLQKHRMVLFSEVGHRVLPPNDTMTWSITGAMALAVDLGATSIDVFGHDMLGDTDISGFKLPARKSNWERVSAACRETMAWVRGRGVNLEVHEWK